MTTVSVVVTGASGTIGSRVVTLLQAQGVTVRAAARHVRGDGVRFDFMNAATWDAAFAGASTMFVVRPPALGNVRRDMIPALERARALGVRHMVLLSVQGAESVPVLPHAALERWTRKSGLAWTFLRPAYFHQNLTGTLRADVQRGEIALPSGHSRMAFVDADDVAAVAARVCAAPDAYAGRAFTLTSDETPPWAEVARTLSDVLGRPVRYRPLGPLAWMRHAHRDLHLQGGEAVMTGVIHASARLGRSAVTTPDVRRELGRDPRSLRAFAEDARSVWGKATG